MKLDKCKEVTLNKATDPRGNLVFVESGFDIPFKIERIYYLYDVPYGSERGGHAHKELEQLIIPLSGSFDLVITDGYGERTINMSNPSVGIYLCSGIWRELKNFTSGAVCLVLASRHYDEFDYIRSYDEFIEHKNG